MHESIGPIGTLFAMNRPMARLLTERDAARRLGLSVRTLHKWRLLGQRPRYLKLGQAVRYNPDEMEAFVQAARRTSTLERSSDPAGESGRM